MNGTNTTISDILLTGMNNPECSFYVGAWAGGYFALKILFSIIIAYAVLKAVDKLAWTPFIEWIKKKIYKKK